MKLFFWRKPPPKPGLPWRKCPSKNCAVQRGPDSPDVFCHLHGTKLVEMAFSRAVCCGSPLNSSPYCRLCGKQTA